MRNSRTARDAGLRQVSTVTKWIAGAAAVLTGFITVWEVHSSHDANATPAVVQSPSTSSVGSSGDSSTPSTSKPDSSAGSFGGLQAPDLAPAPSDRQPAASSGGS